MLIEWHVTKPTESVADWQGSCCQLWMPLERVWGQELLPAIFSFKNLNVGSSGGGGCRVYPKLILWAQNWLNYEKWKIPTIRRKQEGDSLDGFAIQIWRLCCNKLLCQIIFCRFFQHWTYVDELNFYVLLPNIWKRTLFSVGISKEIFFQ